MVSDIMSLIGNTPIVKLRKIVKEGSAEIYTRSIVGSVRCV